MAVRRFIRELLFMGITVGATLVPDTGLSESAGSGSSPPENRSGEPRVHGPTLTVTEGAAVQKVMTG
jgi:hypothetical protein